MLSSVVLKPGSYIFLEIDPCHKFLLPALLKEINEKIEENGNKIVLEGISKDFLGNDRFAILKKCIVQKLEIGELFHQNFHSPWMLLILSGTNALAESLSSEIFEL